MINSLCMLAMNLLLLADARPAPADALVAGRWEGIVQVRAAVHEIDFSVDVRIRSVERAYSYERSELAAALASFLADQALTPPLVVGVTPGR